MYVEYLCWQPSWPALGSQFFKLLHHTFLNQEKIKSLSSSGYLIFTLENGQSSLLEAEPTRLTALQQPAQEKCLDGLCFEAWLCPNGVLWVPLFPSICNNFNFDYVTFVWENKNPPQPWEFFQCNIPLQPSELDVQWSDFRLALGKMEEEKAFKTKTLWKMWHLGGLFFNLSGHGVLLFYGNVAVWN